MEYAVYVVIIEDSSDADQALAEHVESLQRIAADKLYEEAQAIADEVNALYPISGF